LDSIWFVDYPDAPTRESIWRIYIQQYGLDDTQLRPSQEKPITGAEVKSTCRIAALLGVSLVEAARFVVPVSSTSAEPIDLLRNWAKGRALCVSKGGLFGFDAPVTTQARRSRTVKPSLN
jgi:SpoVK/Ycf46/Vps4 family AAA+-type ATPase